MVERDGRYRPSVGREQSFLSSLLYRRALFLAVLLGVIAIAIVAAHATRRQSKLMESMARSNAALVSTALSNFRTLYTSEVVERVRGRGLSVTHDYLKDPAAIPLPATLSIMLGNRIAEEDLGSVRLFSEFPFPWRQQTGGPRDSFERDAIAQLEKQPNRPFVRVETGPDGPVLRYATADLMRPSCVSCHNSHPDSPKTDWEKGDVRGVLEVTTPLKAATSRIQAGVTQLVLLVSGLFMLLALAGGVVQARLKRDARDAEQLAEQSAEAYDALRREVAQREEAEDGRRRLEVRMLEAQKLESLSVLTGGIAHDFNNLLVGILGNASLVAMETPKASKSQLGLQDIQTAARRASELVRQMLAYAGRGSLVTEKVDLAELVREMTPLVSAGRPSDFDIRYVFEADLPMIQADPTQLRQVIMNLVTNAQDALGGGSKRISIRTGTMEANREWLSHTVGGDVLAPGSYVYLEVEDEGGGMDDETRTRIFDPFFTTKGTGRGLGLAALLGIVRSHGGGLRLDTVVGKGSTFRLVFPLSDVS